MIFLLYAYEILGETTWFVTGPRKTPRGIMMDSSFGSMCIERGDYEFSEIAPQ